MVQVTVAADSLRQVDRIKATIVGKTYPLTLTKNYVAKWGLVEAIRELIQNALDSPSPFIYSWIKEDEQWTLMLNSELAVLSPQTLLLGATNKGEDPNAIGSFGEGYKLALLVLCREGILVDMLNGDVLWRPAFRYNRNFDSELLHIDESFLQDKGNKGLTFYVRGLSDQDKEAIEASCIRMQSDIGAIKQTQYGDILMEQKGRLYVGGLFICTTEMHYGYNIKPSYIVLERDRQTVDTWELGLLTAKMWFDLKEPTVIAKMMYDKVPDVDGSSYNQPEYVKEACYALFKEKYPGSILADSPEDVKEALKKGFANKVYVGGGGFGYGVSSSSSYKGYVSSYASPPRPKPEEVLARFKSAWEESMTQECNKAFDKLVEQSKEWRLM